VIAFIKVEQIFIGTASELAEKMKSKTRPNILAKKLVQNRAALAGMGITIENSRTGTKRELTLMYEPSSNDSNDGNDGKNDSGPVSDLLSQPSLLSQTEATA
jgi:hypothetical protein